MIKVKLVQNYLNLDIYLGQQIMLVIKALMLLIKEINIDIKVYLKINLIKR